MLAHGFILIGSACGIMLELFRFKLADHLVYFFSPLRPAFFANISFFAANRLGDLYGPLDVFLFGLNEINRDMAFSVH